MNLREAERQSIRDFVQTAADEGYLSGAVLDVGAGRSPYQDIVVTAGGIYYPYDRRDFPANVSGTDVGEWLPTYQSILCTQVVQYVPDTHGFLTTLFAAIKSGGHLVLTYPTNWPEVEPEDLYRFTQKGMEWLLGEAGFEIMRHDWRHGFQHEGVSFTVGYGVVARA